MEIVSVDRRQRRSVILYSGCFPALGRFAYSWVPKTRQCVISDQDVASPPEINTQYSLCVGFSAIRMIEGQAEGDLEKKTPKNKNDLNDLSQQR